MKARIKPTESGTSFRKNAGMRIETSQVVCWSVSIIMNFVFGYGNNRLTRCCAGMDAQQIQYIQDCKRYGNAKALEMIKQRASGRWIDPVLHWPEEPDKPPVNTKEYREYCERMDHRQEVCQLAWCMYTIGISDALGFGAKRFKRLHDLTEERLRQYVEDAATCEFDHSGKMYSNKDYAFEKLRIQAEHIFKQGCDIRDESDEEGAKRTAEYIKRTEARAVKGMIDDDIQKLKKIAAMNNGPAGNVAPFRTPLLRLAGEVVKGQIVSSKRTWLFPN